MVRLAASVSFETDDGKPTNRFLSSLLIISFNCIFFVVLQVIEQYFQKYGFTGPVTDTYETRKHELLEFFEAHDDRAPFTIQRFAELLQDCSKQYSKTHKLMNALERLLMVTSSYDDNFS